MSVTRSSVRYLLNSAQAATGIGKVIDVRDFQFVILTLGTAGSATLTAKIQGGVEKFPQTVAGVQDVPTFTSAASATNLWSYLNSSDVDTATAVSGATGYAAAGTDIAKVVKVNVQGIDFLTVNVTAFTSGTFSCTAVGYTNE